MPKCWFRQVYWTIKFLHNFNTESTYKSLLGGVRRLVFEHELMRYWHWVRTARISYCSVTKWQQTPTARHTPAPFPHTTDILHSQTESYWKKLIHNFVYIFWIQVENKIFRNRVMAKAIWLLTDWLDFVIRDQPNDLLVAGQASLYLNIIQYILHCVY